MGIPSMTALIVLSALYLWIGTVVPGIREAHSKNRSHHPMLISVWLWTGSRWL